MFCGKILKISIFGMPGSGKTTLAKDLGITLGFPVYHIDKLIWDKGWILRDRQGFLDDHQKILRLDRWVFEGASMSGLGARYAESHCFIYLSPSRFLCLYRVMIRLFRNQLSKYQPLDKPDGCYERVTFDFLRYLWRFKKVAEQKVNALACEYPNTRLIKIESRKDYLRMRSQLIESIKLL